MGDIQRLSTADEVQSGQGRAGGTSLEVAPGGVLDPISIHRYLQTLHGGDADRTRDFPFCWLFRNYSAKFARNFLTALLGDPLLLTALTHLAIHAKRGAPWVAMQGFPGSGKTHIMVLIAMVLITSVEAGVVWTTHGNKALESAAQLIEQLWT